jgi:hypothetical protein
VIKIDDIVVKENPVPEKRAIKIYAYFTARIDEIISVEEIKQSRFDILAHRKRQLQEQLYLYLTT